ncbi:MAG: hypothetical protein RR636_14735 [Clostridium sp.]
MDKIILTGIPEISKEEFVRDAFSEKSLYFGFRKLHIQKKFPDCTAIDLRNGRNKEVFIEFEYLAGNFIHHNHLEKVDPHHDYIVICWLPTGKEKIPSNIEVIVLSEYPNVIVHSPDDILKNISPPNVLFKAMGFNPSFVEGKSIDIFSRVSCFVTNNTFKNDYLPEDSIVVLYNKKFFIGEFRVLNYIRLPRKPQSDYEKILYNLLSYPITFIKNITEKDYYKSFIAFDNFRKYPLQVPCSILNINLSNGGATNLSYNDIQTIRCYK